MLEKMQNHTEDVSSTKLVKDGKKVAERDSSDSSEEECPGGVCKGTKNDSSVGPRSVGEKRHEERVREFVAQQEEKQERVVDETVEEKVDEESSSSASADQKPARQNS